MLQHPSLRNVLPGIPFYQETKEIKIFALLPPPDLCVSQHRYVVVDMETGVPQRDVRVWWNKNQQTHSIWDGSFYMDDVRDSVEIFKPGYMTRIMKPEELTDTILPAFNKLSEVVIISKYKSRKFGWTLKPLTKEEIAAKRYLQNTDLL